MRGVISAASYSIAVGIPGELTPALLEPSIAGTRIAPGAADDWDAEGFRQGIADLRAHGMTVEAVKSFWKSAACRVPIADVRRACAALEMRTPSFIAPILDVNS